MNSQKKIHVVLAMIILLLVIIPCMISLSSTYAAESDVVTVGDLLDEKFFMNNSWWPYAYQYRFPSGWETNCTTHGTDWDNSPLHYFKLIDTSTSSSKYMKKRILSQTSGKITFDFRFKLSAAVDGVVWQLKSGSTVAVSIKTNSGNLCYENSSGSAVTLQAYSADTEYDVKVIADITADTADIFVDGVSKATGVGFRNAVANIDYVYISTSDSPTVTLTSYYYKIYKGYIIKEAFMNSQNNIPSGWTTTTSGGTALVKQWAVSQTMQDQKSFNLADTSSSNDVTLGKSFAAQSSKVVFEYSFILPSKVDGYFMELKNGATTAVQVITNGGNLCYKNSGGTYTTIKSYDGNLWYDIKIVADPSTGTADIYVNHDLKCTAVSFANAVSSFDNIIFSTSSTNTGPMWVDDIVLYPYQSLPGDYVPTPAPVSHSPYVIGMQAFSTWREGSHNGYDWMAGYTDKLQSYLGFYTENTESVDWQIKWMADHGIDFVMQNWVRYQRGNPVKEVCNQFSMDLFYDSQYSNYIKNAIMNDGHYSDQNDFRSDVVPFMVDAFSNSKYMKVDNKPLLFNLLADSDKNALEYVFKDTFDDYWAGNYPDVWVRNEAAGAVTIQEIPSVTNKSAKIYDNSTGAFSGISKTFLNINGKLSMEVKVRAEQTNSGMDIFLKSDSTSVATLRFHSSGNLGYIDASGEHTIQAYSSGTFYTFKILADTSPDKFDLYLDGSLVASNCSFISGAPYINNISIESWTSTTGTFYVDYCKLKSFANINNQFDDETTGTAPYTWTLDTSAGGITVENVPSSSDKSVKLYDSSTTYGSSMTKTFSKLSIDNVKNSYDYLRKACTNAGFAGLYNFVTMNGTYAPDLQNLAKQGYDYIYAYNWGTNDISSQENTMIAQRDSLSGLSGVKPGMVPTLTCGYWPVPWGATSGYYDGYVTAGNYKNLASWAKDTFMPSLPSGLGNTMVMLDNWDEQTEGHSIIPSGITGFGFLDAIRSVFSTDPAHTDSIPTSTQRERLNSQYPQSFGNGAMKINRRADEFYALDMDDYTSSPDVSNFVWSSGGYAGGDIIGNDSWIMSPDYLGVKIDSNKLVKVKFKNSTSATIAGVYFITDSDTTWSGSKMKTFTINANDPNYTEYTIDMSSVSAWTGTLRQLRFDPRDDNSSGGSFSVDYIRIQDNTADTPPAAPTPKPLEQETPPPGPTATPTPTPAPVTFESSIRAEQTNHGLEMYLMSGSTVVAQMRFHSNGNISYIDGLGEHSIQSYSSGSYYRLKIVANASTYKFDVYINDVVKATNCPFINNLSTIDQVKFETWQSTTGIFYITDVIVEETY